jgi:hypothetical protein
MGAAWIDVRDLGLAHQLALEKEEAGGERLIVSAGTFKWQDFGMSWFSYFFPILAVKKEYTCG